MRTLIGRTQRRILVNGHWENININPIKLAILIAKLESLKGKVKK